MRAIGVLSCLACILAASPAHAERVVAALELPRAEAAPLPRWGTLSLRLVYDGDPPAPRDLRAPPPLVVPDETLLVNAKDRGIANVCLYLYTPPGQPPVAVHPAYQRDAGATVTMTADGGRFEPHVRFLRTTQTLKLSHADAVGYNFNANFFNNKPFNVLLRPGDEWTVILDKPETTPVVVASNIHPWMRAYLLVRDNPYAAVSDANGKLTIAHLPVGKHTFIVWHEAAGLVREANIGGRDVELKRGRWELEIQPGRNDLGEIKIKPAVIRPR